MKVLKRNPPQLTPGSRGGPQFHSAVGKKTGENSHVLPLFVTQCRKPCEKLLHTACGLEQNQQPSVCFRRLLPSVWQLTRREQTRTRRQTIPLSPNLKHKIPFEYPKPLVLLVMNMKWNGETPWNFGAREK